MSVALWGRGAEAPTEGPTRGVAPGQEAGGAPRRPRHSARTQGVPGAFKLGQVTGGADRSVTQTCPDFSGSGSGSGSGFVQTIITEDRDSLFVGGGGRCRFCGSNAKTPTTHNRVNRGGEDVPRAAGPR